MKSNRLRRIPALVLTAVLAASSFAALPVSAADTDPQNYGLADSIQKGTILHCFDWKYTDIMAELPNIAKAGFTSVQTSPAQGIVQDQMTWMWMYQPTTFSVQTNPLGTKTELKNLCTEAKKYGINVIVDVVANHMAGDHTKIQDDLKPSKYWHSLGKITNYSDRNQVINGDLGMKDLKSENTYVQSVVSSYIDELKTLGVSGIRWDAAKHIGLPSENCDFWSVVTNKGLYNYGEILSSPGGSNSKALMAEYTKYMSVTDNGYGNTLLSSFMKGTAPSTNAGWTKNGISADKLVYWGESHDTYANEEGKESNAATQNQVDRAYAVVTSRNDATSLYLSRPYATSPGSIRSGDKGSMHFTSAEVAAVNHFHNAMAGKEDSYAVSNNCSVTTRKDGGAVIVLGSGGNKKVSVTNVSSYAKAGTYKDEVTGNTFTVTKDTITGTVGNSGIAVIYDSGFTSRVEASVVSDTTFNTEALSVTLRAIDVTNTKYTVKTNSSTSTASYTDNQTIEIGKDAEPGSTITLTLTGNTKTGKTVSSSYNYFKAAVKIYPELESGGMVFDNSKTNWKKVNVYVYDESVDKNNPVTNGSWPGAVMTDCKNGLYKYLLPKQFASCKNIMVIFNNGSGDQIPAPLAPGMSQSYTEKKLYDGTIWMDLPVTVVPTGITLSKTSVSVEKGKTVSLTATVAPSDAVNKTVTWTSSDSNVAAVSNGVITAKSAGTATITAKTYNGKTASCKVTVTDSSAVAVKGVSLNKTATTIGKGETISLTATVTPSNASNKTITWTSSNTGVATVSAGKVKGISNGTATITAKSNNGVTAKCTVTVKNAPASITLTKGILTIGVGEKYEIGSGVNSGAGCATRTYRTSNSSVVKMTRTDWVGNFYGVKPGVAYVTVKTYNGKESTCKVTVKNAPVSVKVNKAVMTLKVGQTGSLSAIIPDGSGCASRTFRTSNSSVVKMTKTNWTGEFKAVKEGTAYVTVRTYNGKEASCKVTVKK